MAILQACPRAQKNNRMALVTHGWFDHVNFSGIGPYIQIDQKNFFEKNSNLDLLLALMCKTEYPKNLYNNYDIK